MEGEHQVEEVQPRDKMIIGGGGKDGAEEAVNQDELSFATVGKGGESEAGGVEGVIVRGPNVQAQHEDGNGDHALGFQREGNVVGLVEGGGDGAKKEHERIAE